MDTKNCTAYVSYTLSIRLSIAATVLGAQVTFAQTTRAEENRAKREAKAARLEPARRSKLEAVFFKVEDSLILERLLNPPRGIHLRLGGIGEGAGFGVGPGYRYTGSRFDMRASAAATLKRYGIAEAAVRFPGTVGEDLFTWANGPYVELSARRRDFPQEDFYGLGPDSAEADRSNYAIRDTFGADHGRRAPRPSDRRRERRVSRSVDWPGTDDADAVDDRDLRAR